MTAALKEMSDKRPDVIFINIGGANTAQIIQELMAAGVTPALFVSGRIENLAAEAVKKYPNAMYSLAWDRPPEVYNDRLRSVGGAWLAREIPGVPGNECRLCPVGRGRTASLAILKRRPIRFGAQIYAQSASVAQYADMVALVAATADTDEKTTDIMRLRKKILADLQTKFAAGRGAFKGSFDNWSFVPPSRSAARDPFLSSCRKGSAARNSAPVQFVRTKKRRAPSNRDALCRYRYDQSPSRRRERQVVLCGILPLDARQPGGVD